MGLELELVIIMKHLMKIMEMHYCVVVQSTFFTKSEFGNKEFMI